MKQLLLMILTAAMTVTPVSEFNEKEVVKMFLDNPLTGCRYDPTLGKVYGIYRSNQNIRHAAAIDVETRRLTLLSPLEKELKFPTGAAALDIRGHRYFFIGVSGKTHYLYVYNVTSGALMKRHELKNQLSFIEYHSPTDRLYGFYRRDKMYRFVSFAIESGEITEIGQFTGLSRLMGQSRKIDEKKGLFVFEGEYKDKISLLVIGLSNGRIKRLNAHKVSINEFRVHVYGKEPGVNRLYTFGAANCTIIAGYCRGCRIGFLAHFSPFHENTAESFRQIDREIKNSGGKGLAHMTLTVAGGRVSMPASLENALRVYRELEQTGNAVYKGDRRMHLGLTYSMIMDNGEIDIFAN